MAMAGLLLLASAAPLAAQIQDWQNQWYWGAKGGLIRYALPSGNLSHPQAGGEWMITAHRAALMIGYATTFVGDYDKFTIPTIPGTTVGVQYDGMQRYSVALLVFPWGGHLQPYAGGGFVIEKLSNAVVNDGTLSTAQVDAGNRYLAQHASGAFLLATVGLQLRFGKAALFGQAQFNSHPGTNFILPGSIQSFEVGLRYAFLGSREEDITTNR
jgi:hypothetical protein